MTAEPAPLEQDLDGRRWVRIMCDVTADGVWNWKGEGCPADSLPIPPDLVARLRTWQVIYDDADLDDFAGFDWNAFSAEGLAIARQVKIALPAWTVIYFDEVRLHRGERPYEIEIT